MLLLGARESKVVRLSVLLREPYHTYLYNQSKYSRCDAAIQTSVQVHPRRDFCGPMRARCSLSTTLRNPAATTSSDGWTASSATTPAFQLFASALKAALNVALQVSILMISYMSLGEVWPSLPADDGKIRCERVYCGFWAVKQVYQGIYKSLKARQDRVSKADEGGHSTGRSKKHSRDFRALGGSTGQNPVIVCIAQRLAFCLY